MPESSFDPFRIRPVAGPLALRPDPSDVPVGGYRWVQNARVTAANRLCRMSGWTKFLGLSPVFNNSDYHDQLGYTRQHITTLYEAEFANGFSKLMTGMQNRVSALNNWSENWKVISDDLGGVPEEGCSERRWSITNLDRTVLLTNDFDLPKYHIIDQPSNEEGGQAVANIRDFERLNITKVALFVQWAGLVFAMNIVMDGVRFTNRIIWSDYKRPVSFFPDDDESLAGRFDLEPGECILNAKESGNVLWIYTTHRIWEVAATGGEQVLSFRKRYSPDKTGARCLVYPNTLVTTGFSHYYMAADGVYKYDPSEPEPRLVDWIHLATNRIFDNINTTRCKMAAGAYNTMRKEIWYSWGKQGETCNTETMIINVEHPFVTIVDHGFSAFLEARPDRLKSLRAWMIENCVCTIAELASAAQAFIDEGGFCNPEAQPECPTRPLYFYTDQQIEGEDYVTEDCAALTAHPQSLYALLGDTTIEDLCGAEFLSDQCGGEKVFLMVSVDDIGIKQDSDVYYRERILTTEGCGTYIRDGYRTLLRSGPLNFGLPDDAKVTNGFVIDIEPQPESVAAEIAIRLGAAARPLDPNTATGTNVIRWFAEDPKRLTGLDEVDASTHEEENTAPDYQFEWPFLVRGMWIYYELEISNPYTVPVDQGGAACWSEYRLYAIADERNY